MLKGGIENQVPYQLVFWQQTDCHVLSSNLHEQKFKKKIKKFVGAESDLPIKLYELNYELHDAPNYDFSPVISIHRSFCWIRFS